MKKVLIVLTDGFEEIEAVTPIDILRRGGIEVMVAGLDKKEVTGSHGIRLVADLLFKDFKETPDAILIPGGPGAKTLGQSKELQQTLKYLHGQGKLLAAICAAPAVVLAPAGLLEGKKATCFPGMENQLGPKTIFSSDRVVVDGNVVTSRGAGTAMEFALELVKKLAGPAKATEVSGAILARA